MCLLALPQDSAPSVVATTDLKTATAQGQGGGRAAPSLDGLDLARLRFSLIARSAVRFAQAPTSTLWSALGRAAHARDRDLYGRLFKTDQAGGGAASPFVLALRDPGRQHYRPGEEIAFDLTLVGWATAHLDLFVQAALMLEADGYGLGSDRDVAGRVYLSRVLTLDAAGRRTLLLERGDAHYHPVPLVLSGAQIAAAARALPERALTLRFATPTHLKKKGQRVQAPRFRDLIARLGWRVHELMRLHCAAPSDFRPLVERARHVRTVDFDVTDAEGVRYSRRQSLDEGRPVTLSLSGFTGTLTVAGDLAPFRPLLLAGRWLHVGKGTVRGYGRYRIDPARLPLHLLPPLDA